MAVLRPSTGKQNVHVRVIAERDAEGKWQVYITNLPANVYRADEIAQLYRLRWQVELFFKELKSGLKMDRQSSAKAHIVELRMMLLLLGFTMSGRLCQELGTRDPNRRYPVSRGLEAIRLVADEWLMELCRPYRAARGFCALFKRFVRDLNVVRKRSLDPLILAPSLSQIA